MAARLERRISGTAFRRNAAARGSGRAIGSKLPALADGLTFAALDEITRENLAGQLASIWAAQQPSVVWVTHNIYEAIRLADRVLVFSAAPGRIIADIAIRLPRPRNEADAEFQALLLEIRSALQQAAPAEV